MKVICVATASEDIRNALSSFSELVYVPRIKKDELVKIVLEDECPKILFVVPNNLGYIIDEDILNNSEIVAIGTVSTGTDHIDIDCCKKNNIKVFSLREEGETINKISSTAEHAFALMMSLVRRIPTAFDSVKKGEWDFENYVGRQIKDMTIGIVGYGRLGRMFYNYCSVFTSNILISDPHLFFINDNVSLEELFDKCDIISLHVPLDEYTKGMINIEILSRSSGAYLINTSRGSVVNERDVILALANKNLAGYATDVLADELADINKSIIVKNCNKYNIIITPHVGGATKEAHNVSYGRIVDMLKE